MRRLPGVVAAAVVLALLTILGFLCLLLSASAMFVTRYPLIPHTPEILTIAAITNLAILCFLIWCAWTVPGLLRLRRRARRSMMAVGALSAVCSGLIAAEILRVRAMIPEGMTVPGQTTQIGAIALWLALAYAAAALIGLWWLIYFSLPHVRRAFQGEPAAERLQARRARSRSTD